MIPFAILGGSLRINHEQSIEIRILELSSDGFTFRLPLALELSDSHPEVSLWFYDKKSEQYRNWKGRLTECVKMDVNRFWIDYQARIRDTAFAELASSLSREYLCYIDWKQNGADVDYSENFPANRVECFQNWGGRVTIPDDLDRKLQNWYSAKKTTLAYALETPARVKRFLTMEEEDFRRSIWEEYRLTEHPLSKLRPNALFLGNSYCRHLLPTTDAVLDVLRKATTYGMRVYLVLPPASESDLDLMKRYIVNILAQLHTHMQENRINEGGSPLSVDGWMVNDAGILAFLTKDQKLESVQKGPLMCKSYRDSRIQHLVDGNEAEGLMHSSQQIWFPFYQMNTGTFCPLAAKVQTNSRGYGGRVTQCDGICARNAFLYPREVDSIGRFNSLFGWNGRMLEDLPLHENEWVINL